MTTHLLVDFGEVISEAQPAGAVAAMAGTLGLPVTTFRERYWASRVAYDAGQPAHAYWDEVAGRPVRGDELADLRRQDLESWTHLSFATITALRDAHRRGATLTLLSNAPHDLAGFVRGHAVLTELFSLLLFSAELQMVKPSPEIFEVALSLAGRSAEETLFVDDRTENVAAARDLGIRTHRFTSSVALDQTLRGIDFSAPTPDGVAEPRTSARRS